jgi:hypothetical protein
MADWLLSTALASLRSLLGDTDTSKFVFRGNASPPPDGVTMRFFAGDSRLVPGTLDLLLSGLPVAPSGAVDPARGTFQLAPSGFAPAANAEIHCSYYYEWFTDAELTDFIGQALPVLNATDVTDTALPLQVRPVVLQFAAYYAYMYKAAEYASALSSVAPGGFTADRKTATPNWASLAKQSYDTAGKLLTLYNEGALRTAAPNFVLVTYRLPNYVPKS